MKPKILAEILKSVSDTAHRFFGATQPAGGGHDGSIHRPGSWFKELKSIRALGLEKLDGTMKNGGDQNG